MLNESRDGSPSLPCVGAPFLRPGGAAVPARPAGGARPAATPPPFGAPFLRPLPPQRPGFCLPAEVEAVLARPLESFRAERAGPQQAEPLTHAALLLDESSSMTPHRGAVVAGFNRQVEAVQAGAQAAGRTLVTLDVFSSTPHRVVSAAPASELRPLSPEEYCPAGATALYDALGDTIAFLLAQPGADEPNTAFLVAVLTDGEDTMSYRYGPAVLRELIRRLEASGRWTFTLMGPAGHTAEFARSLSIQAGNSASFDPGASFSVCHALTRMAGASERYLALRAAGATSSSDLYAEPPQA